MDMWKKLGVTGPAQGMFWTVHCLSDPSGIYWGDFNEFCRESLTTPKQRASQRRYWDELLAKGMMVPIDNGHREGYWLRCYQGVDRVAPAHVCASCGKPPRPAGVPEESAPAQLKGPRGVKPVTKVTKKTVNADEWSRKPLKTLDPADVELELRNYSLKPLVGTREERAGVRPRPQDLTWPVAPRARAKAAPREGVDVVFVPPTASRASAPQKPPSRVSNRTATKNAQQSLFPEEMRKEETEAVHDLLSQIIDSLQSDGDTCTRLKEAADGYRQRMRRLR